MPHHSSMQRPIPHTQNVPFFEVSTSCYYRYFRRIQLPDKISYLAELIAQCQRERGKIYGYRSVQLWLEKEKRIDRYPKTMLRIMRKYGLLSEIRRKRWQGCGQSIHRYENKLNRNFKADEPNRKWATDITYIPSRQGFLYLSVIKDLFDLSIVSYKIGTSQHMPLVLETIRTAMQKEKVADGLLLHSDQGFQYTSNAYFNLTKEYNIIPSMSRRGNPYDNAMAENFFSMLKTECIYRQEIKTFEQGRKLIDDYIHFYNFERFHLKIPRRSISKAEQRGVNLCYCTIGFSFSWLFSLHRFIYRTRLFIAFKTYTLFCLVFWSAIGSTPHRN